MQVTLVTHDNSAAYYDDGNPSIAPNTAVTLELVSGEALSIKDQNAVTELIRVPLTHINGFTFHPEGQWRDYAKGMAALLNYSQGDGMRRLLAFHESPETRNLAEFAETLTQEFKQARSQREPVWANINEKQMQTTMDGTIYGASLIESGTSISMVHNGTTLFSVGNRTKAYKQLQPYIGCSIEQAGIYPKEGDYGKYYAFRIFFA